MCHSCHTIMMSEPVNKTIAFWYYRHQHHAPWWYDGVAAAAVSSAIPTHSSSTSPLAWTMGAVCHRRGFPFLPPTLYTSNILAYGVKIAAIVVVVVVATSTSTIMCRLILTSSFGVLQSGLRTEWCRDHVSPLSHACVWISRKILP